VRRKPLATKPCLTRLGLAAALAGLVLGGLLPLDAQANEAFNDDTIHTATISARAHNYVLGHNDVLRVSVYDAPEFDQEKLRVQPDGKVMIAPFGPIKVQGLTIEALQRLLVEKYSFYLNHPQVTITLEETRPIMLYVSGAVVNPGSYEFNTDLSKNLMNTPNPRQVVMQRRTPILSNVLIAAGGVRFDADLEHIAIKNSTTGDAITVNVLDLITQGDGSQDVELIAGDSIDIPKLPNPLAVDPQKYALYAGASISPETIPIKIYGYVRRPGLVQLSGAMSRNLNSAIAEAGGYLENTAFAPKEVYLSRVDSEGHLVTSKVNPLKEDIALFPNDVVYIPQKGVTKAAMAFDYVDRLIRPFSGFAQGYNNWALMFDPMRFTFFNNR
jgi:protein involved in polysaccharide export with SLBB domain